MNKDDNKPKSQCKRCGDHFDPPHIEDVHADCTCPSVLEEFDMKFPELFDQRYEFCDGRPNQQVQGIVRAFISRIAQDSYAEGIRRARERVLSIELYNSDEIDRHAVVKAFDDLEEEVKK